MAEVVEINIISRVVLDNDILFSFIHEQVEIQGNRTIEAMNNWAYEGLHRLGSKEDIQNLLDTKIVCITQKAVDGYVGLNIEKVDKRFYYTIWFNNNKYENIIMILCQYYEVNYEEFNKLLKKREKSYLTVLLMKKFRCLNSEGLKEKLGIISNRSLHYKIKIAEEKILINKKFRDEYFELEEKIKENLKNA